MKPLNSIIFARYPFLIESSIYVKNKGYELDSIVKSNSYHTVRNMGKLRVLNAISGTYPKTDELEEEKELLSFPIAKMLVSIINDPYLYKRYSLWEAKRAYILMNDDEDNDVLEAIGKNFNMACEVGESNKKEKYFKIHFTDYLRYSANLRDPNWKLYNRQLASGFVYLPVDVYIRLLEEAIREKIQSSFIPVPSDLAIGLEPYLIEIKNEINNLKSKMNISLSGEVNRNAFPPCMRYLLAELQRGMNLPHTARFALTSFLANIGYDKEKIMELYRMAPDFREDLTRYQVEHITGGSGTEYTSPSCKTMTTYGNCYGKDKFCEYVSHPLTYYRRTASRQNVKK